MSENKVARIIGIDELTESLTSATMRALKAHSPSIDVGKSGLAVSYHILVGIPAEATRIRTNSGLAVPELEVGGVTNR